MERSFMDILEYEKLDPHEPSVLNKYVLRVDFHVMYTVIWNTGHMIISLTELRQIVLIGRVVNNYNMTNHLAFLYRRTNSWQLQ